MTTTQNQIEPIDHRAFNVRRGSRVYRIRYWAHADKHSLPAVPKPGWYFGCGRHTSNRPIADLPKCVASTVIAMIDEIEGQAKTAIVQRMTTKLKAKR